MAASEIASRFYKYMDAYVVSQYIEPCFKLIPSTLKLYSVQSAIHCIFEASKKG
jgi:hypothetical protein